METPRTNEDWIYLNHCIVDGDVGAVQQWFEQGTDSSKNEVELFTNIRNPISLAAVSGNEDIFDLLVKAGFNPKSPDAVDNPWHRQPIHLAAAKGHEKLVQLLVNKYCVAIETKDAVGRTALHWSSAAGQAEVTRTLLELGASVNCPAEELSTSLHFAAEAGHGSVCKILMASGADVNLKDANGFSPLHYVVRSQRKSEQMPIQTALEHESMC